MCLYLDHIELKKHFGQNQIELHSTRLILSGVSYCVFAYYIFGFTFVNDQNGFFTRGETN